MGDDKLEVRRERLDEKNRLTSHIYRLPYSLL